MSARLRHYACGSTTHDPAALFRGGDRGIRTFPSGVFLFDDGSGRRVLFDTGYATGEWRTGWKGSVYRRLLPPIVTEDDDGDVLDVAIDIDFPFGTAVDNTSQTETLDLTGVDVVITQTDATP